LHRKLGIVAQVVARDALLGEAPLLCNALNMVVSLHIAISCEHGRLVRGNDHLSVELVVQNSLRNRLAIVGAVTDSSATAEGSPTSGVVNSQART
jgi:hypothetical protein